MEPSEQLFTLYVTYVAADNSSLKIYAQVDADAQADIDRCLAELEPALEAGHGCPHPVDIRQGDVCFARSSEDQKWYRGRITDLSKISQRKIAVKFLDYGNNETVNLSEVRKIDHRVCSIAPQAVEFILADVRPLGAVWDERTLSKMRDMVCYVEAQGMMLDDAAKKICLFVPSITPGSFGHHLVDLKFARAITKDTYVRQELQVGKCYDVYVSSVRSLAEFWVQLSGSEETLDAIANELERHSQLGLKRLKEVAEGTPCVAVFGEDGCYYRAEVVTISNSTSEVLFVDYGNCDLKKLADLYAVPSKLFGTAVQCVRCALLDSERDLSARAQFEDVTKDKEVRLEVVKKSGDGTYLANLTVDGVDVKSILQRGKRKSMSPIALEFVREQLNVEFAYEVTVTSVESLRKFFVVVENRTGEDALATLTKQLENDMEAACARVTENEMVPGLPCCIQNQKGVWCRAQILQVMKPGLVEVQYVDYGSVAMVPSSKVMRLPSAYARNPPVLAMECALHNCTEIRPDLGSVLERMTTGRGMLCQVKGQTPNGVNLVDVYNVQTSPHVHVNMEILKLHGNKGVEVPDPIVDEVEKIYITSVDDKGVIFGQLTKFSSDVLDDFQVALNKHYSALPPGLLGKYQSGGTHVNEFCCAMFTEDQQYYRGQIAKEFDKMVEVFFVDYGNAEIKALNEVKLLESRFAELPSQGIRVKLVDLPCELTLAVRDSLVEETAEVRLIKKERNLYSSLLTDSEVNESIRSKLPGCGAAKRVAAKAQTFDGYEKPILVDQEEEIIVTHCETPSSIGCQLQRNCDALRNLFQETSDHCNSTLAMDRRFPNPQVGQPCAAMFGDDWYRAEITGVVAPDQIAVTFVDFGNTDLVSTDMVQPLPKCFLSLPRQCISCKLEGVDGSDWSPDELSDFQNMLREKALLAIFKNPKSDEPYSINLLDPSGANYNHKIMQKIRPAKSAKQEQQSSWEMNHAVSNGLSSRFLMFGKK